jgi:hypothetical protein
MNKGIPAPVMPARRSSIAQAAGIGTETAGPARQPAPEPAIDAAPQPASSDPATESYRAAAPAVTSMSSPGAPEGRRRGGRGRGRDAAPASNPVGEQDRDQKEKAVLLKLDPGLKARMVATATWTAPHTGLRSHQPFIRQAITEMCERLEQEHNHGEPFRAPATALPA